MTSSTQPPRLSPEIWGNIASYLSTTQAYHLLIAGSIAQRKGSFCLSTVASPTDLEVRAMMRSYFKQDKKEPAAARMLSLSVRAFFDVNQTPIEKLPIGLMPSVLKGIRDVCKNRFAEWIHPKPENLITVAIQHNAQEIVDAYASLQDSEQMTVVSILEAMALICESECIAPYPWIKCVPFPKYLGIMAIRAVRGARWEYLKDIVKLEGFQDISIADFKTALNEAIQKKFPKCLQPLLECSLIKKLPVDFLKEQTKRIKTQPSDSNYRPNPCYVILMQFLMQLSNNSQHKDYSVWLMRSLLKALVVAAELGDSASFIKIHHWVCGGYMKQSEHQKELRDELPKVLEQALHSLVMYNQFQCLKELILNWRFNEILRLGGGCFYEKAVIEAINGHHLTCLQVLCEMMPYTYSYRESSLGQDAITACVKQDQAECLRLILTAIINHKIILIEFSETAFFNKLYSQSRDACKGVFDEFWSREDMVQCFGSLKL